MKSAMFDVIKGDLEELEERLLDAVKAPDALVSEVGEHLVTSGGKRLRPALAILSARGGKDFSLAHVLPLATALELIHTASLVHDDVIDKAPTRRGAPTANAKWDNRVAILSGDYIFAQAFTLIAQEGYGDYFARRLAELVGSLCVGEIQQDREMYRAVADEKDYLARIKRKTADFLTTCCELGALAGGMAEKDAKSLSRYGHAIGMAFQITDDLLDVVGTSARLGKPVGSDIRQGIITLPVIRALAQSPDKDELLALVTNPGIGDADVARALSIVEETDGIDYAKAKADAYLSDARAALPKNLPADIRNAYEQVADFIGDRDF